MRNVFVGCEVFYEYDKGNVYVVEHIFDNGSVRIARANCAVGPVTRIAPAATIAKLGTVLTDLRWILKTERVVSRLSEAIEQVELTLPLTGNALDVSIADVRRMLVDCAHDEDDAENDVCAERIRGDVRMLLGL